MSEAEERARVVAEARTWLRTPYHSNARLKGVGVDCAQLPAAVYEAAGLTPHLDPKYTAQWYLHRDEELFLEWVRQHAKETTRDKVGPGDFMIWKFGRTYSHGAIITDLPEIIHAVLSARCVVLGDIDRDEDLRERPVKFFTLWG